MWVYIGPLTNRTLLTGGLSTAPRGYKKTMYYLAGCIRFDFLCVLRITPLHAVVPAFGGISEGAHVETQNLRK